MNKKEAVELFGSAASLARAVGLTRSRISQWPDELEQYQADRVAGAALRMGLISGLYAKDRPQKSKAA